MFLLKELGFVASKILTSKKLAMQVVATCNLTSIVTIVLTYQIGIAKQFHSFYCISDSAFNIHLPVPINSFIRFVDFLYYDHALFNTNPYFILTESRSQQFRETDHPLFFSSASKFKGEKTTTDDN